LFQGSNPLLQVVGGLLVLLFELLKLLLQLLVRLLHASGQRCGKDHRHNPSGAFNTADPDAIYPALTGRQRALLFRLVHTSAFL
jgi:hypothetical protein